MGGMYLDGRLFFRLASRLVGWFVGWLVGGWVGGRKVACLVSWLIG